jgi:hypothetical protein
MPDTNKTRTQEHSSSVSLGTTTLSCECSGVLQKGHSLGRAASYLRGTRKGSVSSSDTENGLSAGGQLNRRPLAMARAAES